MVEIIFQNKNDSLRFYNHFLKCSNNQLDEHHILLNEDHHIIKISDKITADQTEIVQNVFYEFITNMKRDDWFRSILTNQFYYHDLEEQQQILEILHSILEGKREDLSVFLKDLNEEEAVKTAINHIFQEDVSFSFDSFIKFRLRSYLQQLERYVELAIDEYKLEQEYQMFVHMLRDFLSNREPKMDVLYLLFDEEITFYNQHLTEIKKGELTRMIDRKLLVNHPVYVDSTTIAPLLSLAPKTIFLYTKEAEAPLVRTIKNIFEERVIVKPIAAFDEMKNWTNDHLYS